MNILIESAEWLEKRPDFTEGDIATAAKLRAAEKEIREILGLFCRNWDSVAMDRLRYFLDASGPKMTSEITTFGPSEGSK